MISYNRGRGISIAFLWLWDVKFEVIVPLIYRHLLSKLLKIPVVDREKH